MRRQTATVKGVGVSAPITFDHYISPFSVGFGTVVSGTGTYNIEYTYDDVFSSTYVPASGTWYIHASFAGGAASGNNNIASPVMAARINVLTSVASMVVSATFIQAGKTGD